ncbi:hypothetical protein [Litoribacillus peritrichatus]|uniref:Uncharacterized protein n=1 Tax=Litoribacillus peritrichatus TaxID=718191 RepID=A0ABP7MII2_9GAMM
MSECSIELCFQPNNEQWEAALKTVPKTPEIHQLPDAWWQLMERTRSSVWQTLLERSKNRSRPCIEGWSNNEGILCLDLYSGEEGFDVARAMVEVLHCAGCQKIQAVVYDDECEYIIDDEGTKYPIGMQFLISPSGELVEKDYPEVEYEYV